MEDTSLWVLLFSFAILIAFFLLVASFWFSYRFTERSQGLSPYTGLPLRRASELSYYLTEKVLKFLHNLHQYDNQPFDLNKATFCRDTGRIFPDTVTFLDTVKLDWSFLQKRYPGVWISWGSLNSDQQKYISDAHTSLEGFQYEMSCPDPSPRAISSDYIYLKPGPLYVDLSTKILLGWKEVPGTDLEVLIVQFPKKIEY